MEAAAGRVRDALRTAGYSVDGVTALLGPVAHAALGRYETVPARRATTGGSPLETLVRLFLLQLPVPRAAAAAALPLGDARDLGLVEDDGEHVRAALDVRPHADGHVVSDLGAGLDGATRPLPADHVLGVGGASTTLAEITLRDPVDRALDLGTGSGVQAVHLAAHAGSVVATDVLPRALRLARLTFALSGVEAELREGSLLEPVAGERFDLVVSNPPFVVGAPGRHTYRDAGLPGDELGRRLVQGLPAHLTDGGTAQLLANWVHRRGEDWSERVRAWVPDGCDAWVVQREAADPALYVGTWLRDGGLVGGPAYVAAYDGWLAALEAEGVEAVGFGWVVLRRTGAPPVVRVEDWPHPVEQPLGPEVATHLARARWLADRDDAALLASRVRVAEDVVQETLGEPGAEDPAHVVLRRQRGMRRATRVGTEVAAVVGACDGRAPLGVLLDAVAQVLGTAGDPAAPAVLRELVADGTLSPA